MNETEKAWLAGLFDGEGCVWTRWPKRKNVIIEIKMTCQHTIQHVQNLFPGRMSKGILSKNALGKKPQWLWTLDSRGTKRFLEDVLPYLVTKRQQAINAITLCGKLSDEKRTIVTNLLRSIY